MGQTKWREVACVLVALLSIIFSLQFGGASLNLADLFRLVWLKLKSVPLSNDDAIADSILFSVRLPRTLVAALCGMALSAAGVLSQGLFRNALASPTIIGTTAGGSAAAAFAFYLGAASVGWFF